MPSAWNISLSFNRISYIIIEKCFYIQIHLLMINPSTKTASGMCTCTCCLCVLTSSMCSSASSVHQYTAIILPPAHPSSDALVQQRLLKEPPKVTQWGEGRTKYWKWILLEDRLLLRWNKNCILTVFSGACTVQQVKTTMCTWILLETQYPLSCMASISGDFYFYKLPRHFPHLPFKDIFLTVSQAPPPTKLFAIPLLLLK